MRAYLPICHSDLEGFLLTQSFNAVEVFAPTQSFIDENQDCDEEEIEFLLSIMAGRTAFELRTSKKSPGLVLAIELDTVQSAESKDNSITLTAPLRWDQVQCALLTYGESEELIWFATQEISAELENWK